MISYLVSNIADHASQELRKQTAHYEASYHLVDSTREVRKRKMEIEVLVIDQRFEECTEKTLEPPERVMEDMHGIMEMFYCF